MSQLKKLAKGMLPSPIREQVTQASRFVSATREERLAKWDRYRYAIASRGLPLTSNERQLLTHKDKYKGRRAFVIANGPSLNELDLHLLKDEVTVACNGIFLKFDEMGFLPTYYTVEDRLVAEDRAEEINKMRGVTKLLPRDLSHHLKQDDETIYINFVRDYTKKIPGFSDDFVRHVFWGGTVTYLSLQIAYFVGCREIYVIGLDHSYSIPDKVEVEGNVITSHQDDVNHFHPDYFGKGYRWHKPRVDRMEVSYRKAKQFFDENNVLIFNASARTQLDVFPRTPFADLFK